MHYDRMGVDNHRTHTHVLLINTFNWDEPESAPHQGSALHTCLCMLACLLV